MKVLMKLDSSLNCGNVVNYRSRFFPHVLLSPTARHWSSPAENYVYKCIVVGILAGQ